MRERSGSLPESLAGGIALGLALPHARAVRGSASRVDALAERRGPKQSFEVQRSQLPPAPCRGVMALTRVAPVSISTAPER
jgi:hypothetical protein